MLLFIESFDKYSGSGTALGNLLLQHWSAVPASGAIVTGRTGNGLSMVIVDAISRSVSASPNLTNKFTIGMAIKKTIGFSGNDVRIIDWMQGSASQCQLSIGPTGLIKIWKGNQTTLLATSALTFFGDNGFHYLEFRCKVTATAITYEVHIDGAAINLSGTTGEQTTSVSTQTGIDTVRVTGAFTGANGMVIDDLYILDDNGGQRTTFLGDQVVKIGIPNADGALTAWTPSPAGTHFNKVNEVAADGDSTRVETTGTNNRDSYTIGAMSGVTSIKGVQESVSAQANTSAKNLQHFTRISGNNYNGSSQSVGTLAYSGFRNIWEQNPNTSADWILAGVNGAEYGVMLA